MKKLLLPLTAGLSALLAVATTQRGLSEPNPLREEYPRANNPTVYQPICYMETKGGVVLNLESLCENDDAGNVSTDNQRVEELRDRETEMMPDDAINAGEGIVVPTETEDDRDNNIPIRNDDMEMEDRDTNIPVRNDGDVIENGGIILDGADNLRDRDTNIPIREENNNNEGSIFIEEGDVIINGEE